MTNVQLIFTNEQLAETTVEVHTGNLEDPRDMVERTLDYGLLYESITGANAKNDLAKKMNEQIKATNHPDSWAEKEGWLLFHDHLYIPDRETLCLQVICDHHDHPTAGHFRETKTTELINHKYH